MKRIRMVKGVALALVLGLTGCGMAKNTKVADAEVDRFHQHWNAGEFQAVYDEAHMQFRAAQPAEAMLTTLQSVKKNYGDFKSSKRRSLGFSSDNGITDVKLRYDSVFERGTAVEAFVFRMAGEKALLLNYDIMSSETAAKRDAENKETDEAKRKSEEEQRKAERDARKSPKP